MNTVQVVKIGGNIIDDAGKLKAFLADFAAIKGAKILVHGGGKSATALADRLGVPQTMVEGRRITDAATLDIIVMVYAGLVNKNIVAGLQGLQCNAIGLCGADANIIQSKKRQHAAIDFGFVGDIMEGGVDGRRLKNMLEEGLVPVISPVTHDGHGSLLNINADTMASAIAVALAAYFEVNLTYCFEKKGVLRDSENDASLLKEIKHGDFLQLKAEGIISKGMIPKLDNAFSALHHGVHRVHICHAGDIRTVSSMTPAGTVLMK